MPIVPKTLPVTDVAAPAATISTDVTAKNSRDEHIGTLTKKKDRHWVHCSGDQQVFKSIAGNFN